jgi:cardiolipin synthase
MVTNLPNLLTLFRIGVIPVLVALFYIDSVAARWIALGLFSIAAITDFFDGYIARVMRQQSVLGQFLDPIADKLLVSAAILMMVGFGQIAGYVILPALVILCREILVSGLREFLAGISISMPVSALAKWKTLIQMIAIGFLIIGDVGPDILPVRLIGEVGLWAAALLTLVTGYDYLRVGLRHIQQATHAAADAANAADAERNPSTDPGKT